MSVSAARQAYLTDSAPASTAIANFENAMGNWGAQTTNAEAVADAKPLITALQDLRRKLEGAAWAQAAQEGMQALIGAMVPVIRDPLKLPTVFAGLDAWQTQLTLYMQSQSSQIAIVRQDLGLPPVQ